MRMWKIFCSCSHLRDTVWSAPQTTATLATPGQSKAISNRNCNCITMYWLHLFSFIYFSIFPKTDHNYPQQWRWRELGGRPCCSWKVASFFFFFFFSRCSWKETFFLFLFSRCSWKVTTFFLFFIVVPGRKHFFFFFFLLLEGNNFFLLLSLFLDGSIFSSFSSHNNFSHSSFSRCFWIASISSFFFLV